MKPYYTKPYIFFYYIMTLYDIVSDRHVHFRIKIHVKTYIILIKNPLNRITIDNFMDKYKLNPPDLKKYNRNNGNRVHVKMQPWKYFETQPTYYTQTAWFISVHLVIAK